jgi:hypothetical protein
LSSDNGPRRAHLFGLFLAQMLKTDINKAADNSSDEMTKYTNYRLNQGSQMTSQQSARAHESYGLKTLLHFSLR